MERALLDGVGVERMTWNTPKPGEWKSEELSQGVSLTIRLLTLSMERECNSLYVAGCMFHCEGCYNACDLVI